MKKRIGLLSLLILMFAGIAWAVTNKEQPDIYYRTAADSLIVGVGGGVAAGSPSVVGVPDTARNLLHRCRIITYNTTTTARTIYQTETGTYFVMASSSDDPVTFTLPDAQPGLFFWFIDNDDTAGADLTIDPQSGDKINNQTAGVTYVATGDAYGEIAGVIAISTTEWVVLPKIGTWGEGS